MASVVSHIGSVLAFMLFAAAPVPLGLWAVARREQEARRVGVPQALLIVLAVWCVVQAVVVHALGLLHGLRFAGMVAAEGVVLGVGMWLLPRTAPRAWVERRRHSGAAGALPTLVLLALSFMGLTQLWWSAAMPVVNWDSWAFHMPLMADWQRDGWFSRMAQGAERPRGSYPFGWEAICTLFIVPFGEDMLVTFPNLLAWVLLGLATYLLARSFGAERVHALASAALLLAIHYVADPVNTMHVDLPFATSFMVAIYSGAVAARAGSGVMLGLSAASIGLACATRSTGPVYVGLWLAWLMLVRLRGDRVPFTTRPEGRRLALAGGVIAVLLGTFWYIKNLIEVGHPLGGGSRLVRASFAGQRSLAVTFEPLRLSSWQALYDRAFHELDAPFLALVAMTALWPLALARAGRGRRERSALELPLLLVATGVFFVVTPVSGVSGLQMRLGLPFLAVLAAVAAVGATRAGLHPVVPAAFALLSATRTFSASRLLYPLMLVAVAWGVWRVGERAWPRGRRQWLAVVTALFLGITLVTAAARERRERERLEMYGPSYPYLERHAGAAEPVAYLLSARPYLLYGRRLARPVVYAPLAPDQALDDWAAALRRRNIRIVAIGPFTDGERATAARLLAPESPLRIVAGKGRPGELTLLELAR